MDSPPERIPISLSDDAKITLALAAMEQHAAEVPESVRQLADAELISIGLTPEEIHLIFEWRSSQLKRSLGRDGYPRALHRANQLVSHAHGEAVLDLWMTIEGIIKFPGH